MSITAAFTPVFVWFARHCGPTTLRCGVLAVLGVTSLLAAGAALADSQPVVLTCVPAPYSITFRLTEGTPIEVRNIPQEGRIFYSVKQYLNTHSKTLEEVFSKADAVVTMGNLWRKDPLYPAVRDVNIRVVNIDATRPASSTRTGVSVVDEPVNAQAWAVVAGRKIAVRRPSVYCWLSLANGVRMADLIAGDLMRLYPEQASKIQHNLVRFQEELHSLRSAYDSRFAEIANLSVFCLANEFVYLTDDAGIYVDGYMVKQDIHWTQDDLSSLTARLKKNNIPVVIHKWMPSEPIQKAIIAGGARLVVLHPLDGTSRSGEALSADTYLETIRSNYEAILVAFEDK